MPKTTFVNLDPSKRERFLDEALDEFAGHPYDQASITAIVKRLGIAKGSVYQYFDGKLDLFGHLLELARERKARWFADLPTHDDLPNFRRPPELRQPPEPFRPADHLTSFNLPTNFKHDRTHA